MIGTRLLFGLLAMSVVCLASTAYAEPCVWTDNLVPPNEWTWEGEGTCTLTINIIDSMQEFDQANPYIVGGDAPTTGDPDVSQRSRNRSDSPWTDWHVQITGGTYMTGSAYIYNEAHAALPWIIEDEGPGGFWAHHTIGDGAEVDGPPELEILNIFFSYDVTSGPVNIVQFPTYDYPIPEPASIAAVMMGLVAFGIRRRRA